MHHIPCAEGSRIGGRFSPAGAGSAPWRYLQLPVVNLAAGAWGSFLLSLWGGWRVPRGRHRVPRG